MKQYRLVAKIMNKGEIAGYSVIRPNGEKVLMAKEATYAIAERGTLQGVEVVTDIDGEKHLYLVDRNLADLPNELKDPLRIPKIEAKIHKDGVLIGLACIDENGDKHNYSLDRIWEMTKQGLIEGFAGLRGDSSRVIITESDIMKYIPVMYN